MLKLLSFLDSHDETELQIIGSLSGVGGALAFCATLIASTYEYQFNCWDYVGHVAAASLLVMIVASGVITYCKQP